MVAIVAMLCGMAIWGDMRVAVYIGIGFLMAKAMINAINKNR